MIQDIILQLFQTATIHERNLLGYLLMNTADNEEIELSFTVVESILRTRDVSCIVNFLKEFFRLSVCIRKDQKARMVHVVNRLDFDKDKLIARISLDKSLLCEKPDYESLCLLMFRSKYSFALYNYLKAFRADGSHFVLLSDLKNYLGADNYTGFKDFRVRCLDVAVGEINAFSDMDVSYEVAKSGKAVSRLVFSIKDQKQNLSQLAGVDQFGNINGQLSFSDFT